LKKSLSIPISSKVFPNLSCTNIRFCHLILRSLIHFELILVQEDKHGCIFCYLQTANQFSQKLLLKRLSFLYDIFLEPLSKISWI
jgi:hypothetical protein